MNAPKFEWRSCNRAEWQDCNVDTEKFKGGVYPTPIPQAIAQQSRLGFMVASFFFRWVGGFGVRYADDYV